MQGIFFPLASGGVSQLSSLHLQRSLKVINEIDSAIHGSDHDPAIHYLCALIPTLKPVLSLLAGSEQGLPLMALSTQSRRNCTLISNPRYDDCHFR